MDKKAIALILGVFAAVLCFSLYFTMNREDYEEDKVIFVTATQTLVTETKAPVSSTAKKTTTQRKTTTKTQNKKTSSSKSSGRTTKTQKIEEEVWIDINTADLQELTKLNGIGEDIAANIIEYREAAGGFRNIEEIINVNGIGEKKFLDIMDYIYVENPVYDEESPEVEEETLPSDEETAAEAEDDTSEDVQEETSEEDILNEESPDEDEAVPEDEEDDVFPIDLNEAEKEVLMMLPYVTEEIAEKILELRSDMGRFSHEYELLYIDELTQKEVAEIIEFVIVGE